MSERLGLFFIYITLIFVSVLFILLFRSSLRYETSRVEYSLGAANSNRMLPKVSELSLGLYQGKDPAQVELFIRFFLSVSKKESIENSKALIEAYSDLLKLRPSWPYYYSGLAQIKKIEQNDFIPSVKKAIMLAPFERKVSKSISGLLFSNWESIDSFEKNAMLSYLSRQEIDHLGKLIRYSLRFDRLFEFCDYIYEYRHIEHGVCKREFWQPLNEEL